MDPSQVFSAAIVPFAFGTGFGSVCECSCNCGSFADGFGVRSLAIAICVGVGLGAFGREALAYWRRRREGALEPDFAAVARAKALKARK